MEIRRESVVLDNILQEISVFWGETLLHQQIQEPELETDAIQRIGRKRKKAALGFGPHLLNRSEMIRTWWVGSKYFTFAYTERTILGIAH